MTNWSARSTHDVRAQILTGIYLAVVDESQSGMVVSSSLRRPSLVVLLSPCCRRITHPPAFFVPCRGAFWNSPDVHEELCSHNAFGWSTG